MTRLELRVAVAAFLAATVVLGAVMCAAYGWSIVASALSIYALGVGAWGYLQTGLSLLIVRQIPAHEAFHAAAGQKAVYLPATLAGLAGALGGRARTGLRPRSPLVLAWFVAAAGALGVIDAITPAGRKRLAEEKRNWNRVSIAVNQVLAEES